MGVKLYKYLSSKIKKLKNVNCFRKEVETGSIKKLILHA
jgi:hypothetical protein